MLIVTIHVDAPAGQAIGIKESIAQDLEKYGDVRVVAVEERIPNPNKLPGVPECCLRYGADMGD